MLRAILLYLSNAKWARRIVMNWGVASRMASRFIAGDNFEAALEAVRKLNSKGLYATLDHLGENVTNAEEALQATDAYIEVLEKLNQAGVKSNCSLKLTQLGLALDYDLCLSNMRCIARRAAEFGTLVRIDMEDSDTVDRTLKIYNTLRQEGLTNIGVVIQSYLYRSEEDVEALLEHGTHIRLCKGAYNEPPEVAYPHKSDVDENFDRITAMLIDGSKKHGAESSSPDGKKPPIPAIGTHDPERIEFARKHADRVGLPKEALEFQMLHGIGSDLQLQLVDQGYPVRIYVPYGTEWYPYFMRRLAERPANVWFFLRAFFRG
ncbi:MAG: proline dehydrogenase family protein [Anaerolineales bacterium]|jgi:proline dehydrogenase